MSREKKQSRPWERAAWRLGITIKGRNTQLGGTNSASLGWAALQLDEGKSVIDSGEIEIAEPKAETPPEPLSKAEFILLREDLGMSQTELADWIGISGRNLRYWEAPDNDRNPGLSACRNMLILRLKMENSAQTAVNLAKEKSLKLMEKEAADDLPWESDVPEISLYVYTVSDYKKKSRAYAEGLPHGAHNRLVNLTRAALEDNGFQVELLYA